MDGFFELKFSVANTTNLHESGPHNCCKYCEYKLHFEYNYFSTLKTYKTPDLHCISKIRTRDFVLADMLIRQLNWFQWMSAAHIPNKVPSVWKLRCSLFQKMKSASALTIQNVINHIRRNCRQFKQLLIYQKEFASYILLVENPQKILHDPELNVWSFIQSATIQWMAFTLILSKDIYWYEVKIKYISEFHWFKLWLSHCTFNPQFNLISFHENI